MLTKRYPEVKNTLHILVGLFCCAAAYNLYLIPNNIAAGGFTGIGQLVNSLVDIKVGTVSILLNIPLFLLSMKSLGMRFDETSGRCKRYLYNKARELLACGTNVVLDWGFWSPAERRYAKKMFQDAGYACELHYVAVSAEGWKTNIALRNALVARGEGNAYPVDAGLLKKLSAHFHEPSPEEIDVLYVNDWYEGEPAENA